jgi:hypothetical protein
MQSELNSSLEVYLPRQTYMIASRMFGRFLRLYK